MSLLNYLLSSTSPTSRRVKRGYLPFSEPRYSGSWPFRPAGRYTSAISNAYILKKAFTPKQIALPLRKPGLSLIQDRRRWSPTPDRTLDLSGRQVVPTDVSPLTKPMAFREPDWHKIMNPPRKIDWRPRHLTNLQNAPWWYGFLNPEKTIICLERKMRREIMHALGFAGKTGFKKPIYNSHSHVRC